MNNSSHWSKIRLGSCIIATSVSSQMPTTNHERGNSQIESICSYIVSFSRQLEILN